MKATFNVVKLRLNCKVKSLNQMGHFYQTGVCLWFV